MDPFELAAKLRQVRTIQSELGSSEQVSRIGSVQVVSGVAESDSSGGYVMVNLGGSSVTQDGTQAVECASDVSVKAGQEVQVQIADGKPRVTGVIGWGDAIRTDVDLAATQAADAETLATEAKEAVEAVSQHFWHDSNGAHVSTEAGVADGARNSLWNSLGIFFRSAANNLVGITQSAVQFYDGLGNAAANIMASFGATGSRIGYESEPNIAIDSDSIDLNDGSTTVASIINEATMAGMVIPNSGALVGGKNEPALWIKSTNTDGRVAIGSGHGRPTGEEIQITEGRVYMPSGMSPAAITFGLGGTAATSGTISAEGRITGAGLTSTDEVEFKNVNLTDGTAVSGIVNGSAQVSFLDSADALIGRLLSQFEGSVQYLYQYAQRTVNGSMKRNGLGLGLDANGNPIVYMSAPAAWRTALGKYTRSSVGALDWGTNNDYLIAKSALAYWNGAYSGTTSNLAYCNKGAFGTLATKSSLAAADIPSLDAGKITSGTFARARIENTAWAYLVGSASTVASGNYVRWRMVAGIVFLQVYYRSGAGLTAGSAKSLGNIPANYRPSSIVESTGYLGAGNASPCDIWVETNGNAYIVSATAASSKFYGTLSYPLG